MQVQRFQTGTNRVYLHIVKQRVSTAATNSEVAKKRSVTVVPHCDHCIIIRSIHCSLQLPRFLLFLLSLSCVTLMVLMSVLRDLLSSGAQEQQLAN